MEDDRKWREEHPLEARLRDEQSKYPEELAEQDTRLYIEHLEESLTETQTRLEKVEIDVEEIHKIVKKLMKRKK